MNRCSHLLFPQLKLVIGILEMKRYFHEELEAVRSLLMEMGERAVESANLALRALEQRDLDIADSVIELDDMIDAIETRIDEEVARYVSLRAPVARICDCFCRREGESRSRACW